MYLYIHIYIYDKNRRAIKQPSSLLQTHSTTQALKHESMGQVGLSTTLHHPYASTSPNFPVGAPSCSFAADYPNQLDRSGKRKQVLHFSERREKEKQSKAKQSESKHSTAKQCKTKQASSMCTGLARI